MSVKKSSVAVETVMVCGYFDGLHPGHIRFLEKAAIHGKVIVGVGSDERIKRVKGTFPLFNQQERLAMVRACRHVERAFVLEKIEGDGGVVWEQDLAREQPDAFFVNDDIESSWLEVQREVCIRNGVKFLVSNRDQPDGWQATSSTDLREQLYPYRICLTTGMDQMQLSRIAKGACIGFSVQPTRQFDDRSGMATSTRKSLMHAFGGRGLPDHLSAEEIARVAFALDNRPEFPTDVNDVFPYGSFAPRYITGSVDPITMLIPGVTLCEYNGSPWPSITTIDDEETLTWLEQVTTLVQTEPRPAGEHFQLNPDVALVKRFAATSYVIWEAVQNRDLRQLQSSVNEACDLFGSICPTNIQYGMRQAVDHLRSQNIATAIQGAGHGGYIACFSDDPADRICIELRKLVRNQRLS